MAKAKSKAVPATPATNRTFTPGDFEEIERLVRRALAVAIFVSESGAEEHSQYAASVIVDDLHEVRCIFEGRKGGAA